MSVIVKQDSNGIKPLLQVGELGYDNFPAGGDEGRVYVGTGTSNIAQAKKSEVTAVDSKVDAHVAREDNPHGVTKAQVGLANVDNTSDINKIISTATQTELDLKANRIDVDDLFTDASNLEYDDTFTDMRVADVQAALAHLGEESKYWSNIHSAVRLFGGIIQDNGDGTVRVANGGGLFKKEASSVEGVPAGECEPMQLNAAQGGKLFYETWEATENVQLTNNAYNYIFIVWDHTFDNGDGSFGKARVIASTNFYLQDWESEISYYNFKAAHPELTLPARRSGMLHGFTVGRVYKMDNEITIRVCGTNGWNFNKRVQLFGEEFFPVIRARGLDIQTIPNTLQFNVTEGVMWAEMANRFTVRAFEMDKGDTFTSWYQHTAETTALTLAQIQSTYPTGIANRKYDILYSSTDTKYYRLNPSNNTWGEVLDYINSKVNISTHPANLSVLETLAPTGYVNNSQGTDYVVLQLQATDSFYRYNPNAALGNRWELFGDKSTVHPYVAVAFLGDVAGMNAEYPTGFNDVINVIVGCADGMYYEYSGVSGQSGWKRVQGYIERNGWLRFYKQSAVDALKYNDSTNNKLVNLENGMYGVAWIYMVHDNSCHVVYGQGAYTSEEAKQAALPSPLPGILAAYSTLVGKMTFSRGATTFENAESPFIEKFISSGVSLHNDLAGLDGGNSTQNRYYHLDEPAYNLVNTFADVVDVSPEGDLAIVGDYSGANALFSGNLTVGGTTSGITKTMVGLGLVDNTADSAKNVLSATKLATPRTISLTGDVTGSVSFDGTGNVSINSTVVDDSHNHVISNIEGLQTALNLKANSASPTFTGTVTGTFSGSLNGKATTAGGLAVATGTNNVANQIVRTDGNGYIQCGYIQSSGGNEHNASNPSYVWGTNGSDNYMRTYNTGYLSVNYANSSGSCSGNAETATKLATARNMTIGSTAKNFDGSANVSWSLNEIGAYKGMTLIPDGANLNDYMTPGVYHWFTGVVNTPTPYAVMYVAPWDGTGGETAEQLVMKNGAMWLRGKNNSASSWTAWKTVAMKGDKALVTSPIGALGYGVGAGGTVTQLTSKSTAVTLNKPSGRIVMHNAALAAGASVLFLVNNSMCQSNDTVIVNRNLVTSSNYRIETNYVNTDLFGIRVTNVSAGSLSETVTILFNVIKGVVS